MSEVSSEARFRAFLTEMSYATDLPDDGLAQFLSSMDDTEKERLLRRVTGDTDITIVLRAIAHLNQGGS